MAGAGSRRRTPPTSAGSIPRRSRGCAREAWPEAANADELHDALVWLGFLTADEAAGRPGWSDWLAELARRSARRGCTRREATLWIAAERLPQFQALWPDATARARDRCARRAMRERDWSREEALVEIVRGRLEGLGPVTAAALAAPLGLEPRRDRGRAGGAAGRRLRHARPLHAGRRRARNGASAGCWRASTATRSSACAPRSSRSPRAISCASCSTGSASTPDARMEGPDALDAVVGQLEGFEAPAGAWETEILPARARRLRAGLARRSLPGRAASPGRGCGRATAAPNGSERGAAPVRTTPITLLARRHARSGRRCRPPAEPAPARARARRPSLDFIRAARRLVLRRAGRRHRPVAPAGRGGAGRAGRARPRHFRQLRRLARAAGAVGASASRSPAARRRRRTVDVRHGGRGPLGARSAGAPARRRPQARAGRRSSMSRARCCAATASCSGACSSARPTGCRRGATCCASIAGSRARGEIRGGRFVAGFSGEQFALPEAVGDAARGPAQAGLGRAGLAVRRRPAQPRRHPDARAAARRADRQPPALSRRPADRAARRRRGAVPRDARRRERVAGAQGAAARRGAGSAACPRRGAARARARTSPGILRTSGRRPRRRRPVSRVPDAIEREAHSAPRCRRPQCHCESSTVTPSGPSMNTSLRE